MAAAAPAPVVVAPLTQPAQQQALLPPPKGDAWVRPAAPSSMAMATHPSSSPAPTSSSSFIPVQQQQPLMAPGAACPVGVPAAGPFMAGAEGPRSSLSQLAALLNADRYAVQHLEAAGASFHGSERGWGWPADQAAGTSIVRPAFH